VVWWFICSDGVYATNELLNGSWAKLLGGQKEKSLSTIDLQVLCEVKGASNVQFDLRLKFLGIPAFVGFQTRDLGVKNL
jgi:hypothetical protein